MLGVVRPHLVNGYDRRVVECRGSLCLGVKPLNLLRGRQLACQYHLDRYSAIQGYLSSFIDDTHTAAGDLLEQLIIAKIVHPGARGRRGGVLLTPVLGL